MSQLPQLLIETDILAEYLTAAPGASRLRQALRQSVCYTTMLNALELFRASANDKQREAILSMLYVVRVLGFNARYAQPFAELAAEIKTLSHIRISDREAMILGMARASKLTILTETHYERYTQFQLVPVINRIPDNPTQPTTEVRANSESANGRISELTGVSTMSNQK
jgi:predicted nucleic acid-binding protein